MNFMAYLEFWLRSWSEPSPVLNALLRSALVLLVALGAGMALRQARPETRVLLFRAALLGSLAVAMLALSPSLGGAARWNIALYSSPDIAQAPVAPVLPPLAMDSQLPAPISPAPLPSIATPTARDNSIEGLIGLLLLLWPLGSAVLLSRLVICHFKVMKMRRRAQGVSDAATLEILRECCAAIGVSIPRLAHSEAAQGPFLCGVTRPMILLPSDYAARFDGAALRAIFLHEAAHIRGRDCAWTYARRLACALLWPQPLLWVLARQMETAGEEVCDLAVLEGGCTPRDYARCLVDCAEFLGLSKAERAVGVGMMPKRSALARRVEQILQGVPRARRLSRRARWVLAIFALGLSGASAVLAIDTDAPLGAAGDISGRVVYAGGKPASGLGIEIAIHDAEEGRIWQSAGGAVSQRARKMMFQSARTGADGTYRVKNLLAGAKFNVMVYDAETGAGPTGWVAAAQVVRPQTGKNTRVKDIVLTRGALIEGRIEDAVSGRPLAAMSVGSHGPHRPLSTGMITGNRSDASGRFVLRVPRGKNWVYWNGPVQNLRAEVHFGDSTPYEKDLSVVKSGASIYGASDFVEMRVAGGAPRYSRSGNGALGAANQIDLRDGQTRRLTIRLFPLRILNRPGRVPLVKMSDQPPFPGGAPLAWNPNSKLPASAAGTLAGRVIFPDGKPAASVALIVQIQNRAVQALPDAPAVYSDGFNRLPRAQAAMLKQNLVTGADGTFRATGLLDAPYDIIYTPTTSGPLQSWIAAPLSGLQVRQNQTTQTPNITLQRGAVIRGQIQDATSKQGVPQCFLVVDDARRPRTVAMSELFDADPNGRFSMRVLPGKVRIRLMFNNAPIGKLQTIRLGAHSYDLTRGMILTDGALRMTGTFTELTVRDGQARRLDFRLFRSPKR